MEIKQKVSFEAGDWIVHCYYGVGKIQALEHKSISGEENTYFRVDLPEGTMWIPVDNVNNDLIRPVTSQGEFEQAIERLENPPKGLDKSYTKRKSHIDQVLADNKPLTTAQLIRDLQARRRERGMLNDHERHALRDLTRRFLQEWAVCKGLGIEEVRNRFNRLLVNGRRNKNGRSASGGLPNPNDFDQDSADLLNQQDDKWMRWLNSYVVPTK